MEVNDDDKMREFQAARDLIETDADGPLANPQHDSTIVGKSYCTPTMTASINILAPRSKKTWEQHANKNDQ